MQRLNDFKNIKNDIYKQSPKIEATDPGTYKQDCKEEDQKKLKFPTVTPSYAVLYKDNILTLPIALNDITLKKLLIMLNDSSSYRWGEVGTPEYDIHIVFYDKVGKGVGLAHISYDGTMHLDPYLKKMKWGMVKEPVLDLIKGIDK